MADKKFMLKYFREGYNKKIITKINKKVYFSNDQNITPGLYAGTIIEEHESHGVIDTIPISAVPIKCWIKNQVSGTYVKQNKQTRTITIYRAKSAENRDKDESVYSIQLTQKEAIELWGKDYKSKMVILKNGMKIISTKGYTPFEAINKIFK